MKHQAGLWDLEQSLEALSAEGDPLEHLERTVSFERFRPLLVEVFRRSDPSKGGRPGFDEVLTFRMLVLQGLYGLSLQQTSFQVCDRLTWIRFRGLRPGDRVPDANTLRDFREALIKAGALELLFQNLDQAISDAGYLTMGGQIPEEWKSKPAKLRQKDRNARWAVKFSKTRPKEDGTPQIDIAIPVFGCKSHISIDRRHDIIRRCIVTAAAGGARLREGRLIRTTPPRRCGPIRPTVPRPTRTSCLPTARSTASIAGSRRENLCPKR